MENIEFRDFPLTQPHTLPAALPGRENQLLVNELLAALRAVLDSGWYILGRQVADFEYAFAHSIGVEHAIGVGSGTDALTLAVQAVDAEGGEVITVSHTAGPTAAAILAAGCVPVLVDIDPQTYCLDPAKLEAARSPRTRVVLPVHLYGHPAEMDRISSFARRYGLAVVEDCAQAHGAFYSGRAVGAIGAVGCFSFYPTKNLGALGDAGAIACQDANIAERIRQLHLYGWREPQFAEIPGGRCSRLDELQAAFLLVKLKRLSVSLEERRRQADRYREALAGLPILLPSVAERCVHAWNIYTIQADDRDRLATALRSEGILPGRHYPYAVHQQPGFSRARVPEPLIETERLMGRILTLPLFPGLQEGEQDRVVRAIRRHYGR